MLARGDVHLSALVTLAPHVNDTNCHELLPAIVHLSKRDVEALVRARVAPLPDVAESIRKLPSPPRGESTPVALPLEALAAPAPTPTASPTQPPLAARPVVAPLSAERFKVQFTATGAFVEKLRQVQDLLRPELPDGDVATVCERALDMLLADVMKRRFAKGRGSLGASPPRRPRRVAEACPRL